MGTTAKKSFWEKKVLKWEKARYWGDTGDQAWLERLVKHGGGSVARRLRVAAEFVRPHLEGKILLDAGCGSGLLFRLLADSGARKFVGIDLAQNAINNARDIADRCDYADRSTFLVGNIIDVELPDFDIVVLLGLLDWLSLEEIHQLFSRLEGKSFVASISERRANVQQLLHRIYVFLAYGWRSGSYVPRYYPVSVILSLLERHSSCDIHVYRDAKLSFGVILHNLPARPTPAPTEKDTRGEGPANPRFMP